MNEQLPDASQLSYEQARDELVKIVSKLESGSAPLEETLKLWERGEALAGRCHAILSEAEARLTATQKGQAQQTAQNQQTPTMEAEEPPFEIEDNDPFEEPFQSE